METLSNALAQKDNEWSDYSVVILWVCEVIELRWFHDPKGDEVTKLQYRPLGYQIVYGEPYNTVIEHKWQDVPHVWPTEQHAEGTAVKVSLPLAKE